MADSSRYLIRLRGQVGDDEINLAGPLQMTIVEADAGSTLLSICTDQSGLVGVLRHLHGRGFVILSAAREQ